MPIHNQLIVHHLLWLGEKCRNAVSWLFLQSSLLHVAGSACTSVAVVVLVSLHAHGLNNGSPLSSHRVWKPREGTHIYLRFCRLHSRTMRLCCGDAFHAALRVEKHVEEVIVASHQRQSS
jgi:hypothetical protein